MGALGPLGRNGLYCRNIDVDRFPALAGWRGLNDSAVREYFNSTLHAFVREWGPLEELMRNLGAGYKVLFLGSEASATIRSRLQAGVPTLFYLWSPHSLNAQFDLNRIQLPAYTNMAVFEQCRSDYPTDVLEKVATKKLAEISPDVESLYARFTIETSAQEDLMLSIDLGSHTVMQAVCGWLTTEENGAVWRPWLPNTLVSCLYTQASVRVEPDLDHMPLSTPFLARLSATDVHGLPLTRARAEISVVFGGRTIPVQWNRGSSEYVAGVPARLTGQPGLYDLVVIANNAWNDTGLNVTSCELLRRTISVKEGLNTTWILVGASITAVAVVFGLALVVRKRHAHLQAIMLMLVTEMGMLVLSICAALGHLITDGIVFGRLLRGELKVSSDIYTAAYATILCFGVAATALSLGYRIRNAHLMKAQLQQFVPQGQAVAASEARRQAQQHEWELVKTHRTKVTLSLSLMSIAAQGA